MLIAEHHHEMRKTTAEASANTYNNYAWLLWNKLGSEEAIMYYGRAIELAESYLENGMMNPDQARALLAHYSKALNGIYDATSREKEKKRLLQRLRNSEIEIN